MAPKKKEYPVIVEPKSTKNVEYVELDRQVRLNAHMDYPDVQEDPYDEVIVTRKKIDRGNPTETFETVEIARWRNYRPIPEPPVVKKVEAKAKVEAKVKDG
tara:strand:- start:80 stop:382 length:303 start_codon:yes stop_codon:yes gene_type:complete